MFKLDIFEKITIKQEIGYRLGKLVPFDDEVYKELQGTIVNCCPVSIDIKYLKPNIRPGHCYDRSLRMFYAMKGSVLVRGSLNYFRAKGDIIPPNHGWVERDGFVYDPTFRIKYNKKYYYKMFEVTDVEGITLEEHISKPYVKKYYEDSQLPIEAYKPHGVKRTDLVPTIPLLRGVAEYNPDMKKELDEYLRLIEYEEEEIQEEINTKLKEYGLPLNFS